jgi:Tol biopolymer transport system component
MATVDQPFETSIPKNKAQSQPVMLNFDYIAVLLTLWYMGGLFIDGWAHNHGRTDVTFFTPWHAIFYSGYAVTALFYGWTVYRNTQAGVRWQDVLPKGHHLSLIGLMIFGFGGVFDLLWHTFIGIEVDVEALLSPAHLLLASGMILVFSGAFRSFQYKSKRESWADWFPAVMSVTFTVSTLMFFVQYFSLGDSVIGYQLGEEESKASNNQLYTMNLDGTAQTRLSSNPDDYQFQAVYSPDGSQIAYIAKDEIGFNIYVMNADGSNPVQLTAGEEYSEPTFSPDGSQLAVTNNVDGNFDIYIINLDGTGEIRLTEGAGWDYTPDWSPDGSQIMFTSEHSDGNLDIYVMNADGSNVVRLTTEVAFDGVASWSPDGSQIAFQSDRAEGNTDIYVANADGSNVTRVTTDEEYDSNPAWSPDGSQIIFMSWRDGNQELYSITPDGQNEMNLTNNPTLHEAFANVAPDGTIIYRARIAAPLETEDTNELLMVYGLAAMFISTALLVGAMLLLVREGHPPFGAMTVIWTISFALVATQDDSYSSVALAAVTGLVADILLRVLNVRVEQRGRFMLLAFLTPLVYFALHFAAFFFIVGSIGWKTHVWTGSIFLAGVVAVLLAYVMLPPIQPTEKS